MVMPSVIYVADARRALIRAMANAAQKPVMVYNNPSPRGPQARAHAGAGRLRMDPAAIEESCGDIRRITDLRNTVGDRYQLFCGVDDLAYGPWPWRRWPAGGVNRAFPRETVALRSHEGQAGSTRRSGSTSGRRCCTWTRTNRAEPQADRRAGGAWHRHAPAAHAGDRARFIIGVVNKALATRP